MNDYYPPGSMKGSGIDAFEFDYGTFSCKECSADNFDAIAYGDDWGKWEVSCEDCDAIHDTGSTNTEPEDDSKYDEWKDDQLDG